MIAHPQIRMGAAPLLRARQVGPWGQRGSAQCPSASPRNLILYSNQYQTVLPSLAHAWLNNMCMEHRHVHLARAILRPRHGSLVRVRVPRCRGAARSAQLSHVKSSCRRRELPDEPANGGQRREDTDSDQGPLAASSARAVDGERREGGGADENRRR